MRTPSSWCVRCAGWVFVFSSRRGHTRSLCDWSSDVCSSDLKSVTPELAGLVTPMANGVEWSLFDGGVGYDSSVLIQGPGQQGLSQTVICNQAGASLIKIGRASCRERVKSWGVTVGARE